MSTSPSAYSGIVSPRSRRLRTIGVVLLLAILGMALYGYFGLMPSLGRSIAPHAPAVIAGNSSTSVRGLPGGAPAIEQTPLPRAERVRKLKIAAALAYWGVCALLLLAVVVVAWLDLREVTRNYVAERRSIWSETADRIAPPDDRV